MAVDYDILKRFNTTDERLREFFCVEMPHPNKRRHMKKAELDAITDEVAKRDKFKMMIAGWLQSHIMFSLTNHAKYAAVDMAWDSSPINKQILPLIQYATGRINVSDAAKSLSSVTNGESYVKRDGAGTPVSINLPKFTEVNINLIRSIITRRAAAQSAKYAGLWPFFKFEPRNVSQVGYLRGDLTSQRMDIMSDDYGYRHQQDQFVREMLLYARTVAFPRSYWEREYSYEKVSPAKEFSAGEEFEIRARVTKEGLSWVTPHPSRIFYDNNHPITSLNNDTGCEYVGYWDVCRWGDVMDNPDFFNRKTVSFSRGMVSWFTTFPTYFNQYFDRLIPPVIPNVNDDPAAKNDRKNNIGVYAGIYQGGMEEVATFFTNVFVKVIPQNWGWGTYPYPVWVHLKVAGDNTVVYAKIMPSSPAAVFSYNEHDARMMNISLAMEMMPLQDQLTNLFSQFLETIKRDLFAVAVLNKDVFPDTADGKEAYNKFVNAMSGKDYFASVQILEASFSKLKDLGIEMRGENIFTMVRSEPNTQLTSILQAITTTLNMAERLAMMSAHEQGQTVSHEISATESAAISGTTDVMYNYISTPIEEGRAAMKRICYESLIACGTADVELTVEEHYTNEVIESAGFEVRDLDGDDPLGYKTVVGSKNCLVHNYMFNTRDGVYRSVGTQRAQVIVQLFHFISGLQPVAQNAILSAIGKKKILEVINTVTRDSDAGIDLDLKLKPGESDELLLEDDKQVMGMIQQLAQAVKTNSEQTQAINQLLARIAPGAAQMLQQAQPQAQPQPPSPAQPPQTQ